MKGDFHARVISNVSIARHVSDISLQLSLDAGEIDPKPGQFAHLSSGGVFLRRPISIAGFDKKNSRVRIIVRNAGIGSGAIASLIPGESIRMLIPLGSPYPLDLFAETAGVKKICLIAGGIGAAPLIFAADFMREFNEKKGKEIFSVESFIGFRDKISSFGLEEFERAGTARPVIGGLVTDALEKSLAHDRPDAILACGPEPMLRALQGIRGLNGIPSYVSLEAHMGCGVGACLVCSCRIATDSGHTDDDNVRYRRVCRDGPVFKLSEVVFG
ncbi:MAG: dihydroorotate dehydrogenase electron transfer subunit [Synergistaceae bacterium]|jgi:dihydroorotate dehydrogenase electron transfer subunit|nr:dihydroorotate dehydrogenase electron transfer subunit [Synergistaceae bacterium]